MDKTNKITDLTYISLAAVLIAACSWISVPLTVPFTLQTFAVFCVLELLGGKRGTAAIGLYILLGAVGIPVFAGFSGGIGILLGTTGGYILGFLFTGLLYWLGEAVFGEAFSSRSKAGFALRIASLVLGLAICYAFGTAWFMFVYARQTGAIALGTALSWCVFPFIVPDLIKLGLAVAIAARLRRIIHLR